MSEKQLKNLAKTGIIKHEPSSKSEFHGLLRSAQKRLKDATNQQLSLESQFTLAYDAAHSFALAALRYHSYRPNKNRIIVFQALEHTLSVDRNDWLILDQAHRKRNNLEYEGYDEIETGLVNALLDVTMRLENALRLLPESFEME